MAPTREPGDRGSLRFERPCAVGQGARRCFGQIVRADPRRGRQMVEPGDARSPATARSTCSNTLGQDRPRLRRSRRDADSADALRGQPRRRARDGAEPAGEVRRAPLMTSSSASRSRRTARACPISWCASSGVAGPVPTLIHAYGGFRVAQTPGVPHRPALSRRAAGVVLGRAGQCLCARQHPRRRRIWARDGMRRRCARTARAASTISTPSPRM